MARPRKKNNATRISISLPLALFDELDEMVADRGYASRSEAISKMISANRVRLCFMARRIGPMGMAASFTAP